MSLHTVGASHGDLGGAPTPIGPAAPINWHAGRNRPNELTYNHLRSSGQGRSSP
jgi:hypothetical protein